VATTSRSFGPEETATRPKKLPAASSESAGTPLNDTETMRAGLVGPPGRAATAPPVAVPATTTVVPGAKEAPCAGVTTATVGGGTFATVSSRTDGVRPLRVDLSVTST
jgi:hypothetical protein